MDMAHWTFIKCNIDPMDYYWTGFRPIEALLNRILAYLTFLKMGYWPIEDLLNGIFAHLTNTEWDIRVEY